MNEQPINTLLDKPCDRDNAVVSVARDGPMKDPACNSDDINTIVRLWHKRPHPQPANVHTNYDLLCGTAIMVQLYCEEQRPPKRAVHCVALLEALSAGRLPGQRQLEGALHEMQAYVSFYNEGTMRRSDDIYTEARENIYEHIASYVYSALVEKRHHTGGNPLSFDDFYAVAGNYLPGSVLRELVEEAKTVPVEAQNDQEYKRQAAFLEKIEESLTRNWRIPNDRLESKAQDMRKVRELQDNATIGMLDTVRLMRDLAAIEGFSLRPRNAKGRTQ